MNAYVRLEDYMMMAIPPFGLALALLAAEFMYASAGGAATSLETAVSSFSQTNATPYIVAMSLSTTYAIPIGFEGIPEDPENEVTVAVLGGTVRGVLDKLIAADPRYEWRVGPEGVIDIFPKSRENSPLDATVFQYRVERVGRQQALNYLLGRPEVASALTGLGVTVRTPVTADSYQTSGSIPAFSVALEEVSMRAALNAITRASGSLFWAATLYGQSLQYLSITIAGSAPANSNASK